MKSTKHQAAALAAYWAATTPAAEREAYARMMAAGLPDSYAATTTEISGQTYGRTSEQIRRAPPGAIFIWPTPFSLSYAQHLARHLGRPDLQIVTIGVLLEPHRLRSLAMSPREMILDHAAAEHMSEEHWRNLEQLQARRRRHG